MADAVLNGLTGGRHSDFMEKFRVFEEKERKVKESLRMEVQTTPGNKNPPETRNDSATPSDRDRASNVIEDQASNVIEDQASSVTSSEGSREQTPLGVEGGVRSEGGGSEGGGSEGGGSEVAADESEESGDMEVLEVRCHRYCSYTLRLYLTIYGRTRDSMEISISQSYPDC